MTPPNPPGPFAARILACTLPLLAAATPALAHGSMAVPLSRVYNGFLEGPRDPESAAVAAAIEVGGTQPFYDWNEVVNFFEGTPQYQADVPYHQFIPDGQIASGGNPKYAGLDLVRDDWPTTPISAGPMELQWYVTTPHDPSVFHAWITSADWNPSMPLNWAQLEELPLGPVMFEGMTYSFDTLIPARTGKHVIYVVWQRIDPAGESFHSVSDVDFGSGTPACPADLDASGSVDGADLGAMLAAWGTATADVDGDGTTDGADLGSLLASWGSCLPDCDGDGVSDMDEIIGGASDCNGDGVPDACQSAVDCDGDGLWDACAILDGLVADCNMNLVPDSCEIAEGGDADGNGFLDDCELEGITYLWSVLGSWSTGFQASLTIQNGSDEMLHGWQVSFDTPTYTIDNLWDGVIIEQGGGQAVVGNTFWNEHIEPGESVTFGFIGVGQPTAPSSVVVNDTPASPGQ